MKKIILFTFCALTAISTFAGAYSQAEAKKFRDAKDYNALKKYAYESEVSKNSDTGHMYNYFYYLITKTNNKYDASQILKQAQKFKSIKGYEDGLGYAYALNANVSEAIAQYEKTKNDKILGILTTKLLSLKKTDQALEIAVKYNLNGRAFNIYKMKKDYTNCWKYGVKVLTIEGGLDNPKRCVQIIHFIFRYKPASVTKEQQIEFLTKLADIYPIPGTDFAEWKSFMGFVGFKYKSLTGKDLF